MKVQVKVKNRFKGNVIKTVEIEDPKEEQSAAASAVGSNTLTLSYSGLNALNQISKKGGSKRGK